MKSYSHSDDKWSQIPWDDLKCSVFSKELYFVRCYIKNLFPLQNNCDFNEYSNKEYTVTELYKA